MHRLSPVVLIALTLAFGFRGVQAQTNVQIDKQFASAEHKATIDGDLKGAIQEYKQIVARAGANHAVAAQALLRMAELYQKMGDAEARRIYEQLVRDYADQNDIVATARTRLGSKTAGPRAGGKSIQVIWEGPKVNTNGAVSRDGRYLSIADNETGDLAVHDIAAGTDRRLTAHPGNTDDFADRSTFSPDGTQIAYSWYVEKTGRYELRVIRVEAGRSAAPRTLADDPDFRAVTPYDWSSDGRSIAVRVSRVDRTAQIGLVDAATGKLSILKTVDWRGSTRLTFSPDGKFLAYDLPVADSSIQRDVFVLSVDGNREVPAVVHDGYDAVMAWSPDGGSLLFASDRLGTIGLWAVPMSNGGPNGTPAFIQSDLAAAGSLGITRDGTLVFNKQTSAPNIYVASVDFETGKVLSPPKAVAESYLSANRQPVWSPDGKSLVYRSARADGGGTALMIQPIGGGRPTALRPNLSNFPFPRWAPDGSITVGYGADLKGRSGFSCKCPVGRSECAGSRRRTRGLHLRALVGA